ncbi:Major facilitator superfamily transporter [Cordyceps militaris]|uniref:Major facilitator superfamily transporter n=1 Tax=Cordyceps militaris TaxID=73501 RepID=A0A2H4S8H8_CORMI|nr:Major facilitator superfamily transporter [Cordyceps militaris]
MEESRKGTTTLAFEENGAEPTPPPFTIFTVRQRRWIVFLAAFSGMFSPMSSFIFYPAITSIARGLDVTVELVNLAVTTYMVVSGIVPALLGTAADHYGRRPVYILALSVYLVANIGLACQSSFPALLVLRMLQSAGSSGTISLGYGVMADITTEEDRGSYIGVLLVGPNVAPPIGPILGGVVAAKLGWQWIFWILVILGGFCLALIVIALPETSRAVVGNGSIPPHGIYRSLIPIGREQQDSRKAEETLKKKRAAFFNPLASLKILPSFRLSNVLLCNGIAYTVYCCIQASLSSLFIDVYGYHDLEAGLIYIPFGVACLISTLLWGIILDREYVRAAQRHGITVDEAKSKTDPTFPLEVARLRSSFALVGVASAATCGFGWAIQARTHVAVPLIMQVFVGFATTGLFVALGALNTDLNTHQSSTASAAANIVRCALAAAFLSILQIMIDHIGPGWCFTIFGLIMSLCGVSLYWQITVGYQRRMREEVEGSGAVSGHPSA